MRYALAVTTALTVLLAFASAFLIERVTLGWLAARERRQRWRRSLLGMLHEALTWAPLLIALEAGAPVVVALAAVLGVGAANAWAQ